MSPHFYSNAQRLLASYTFAVGITASALYSILDPIEKDTGLTLNDLNAGTGYMVREKFQCLCHLDAKTLQFLLFGWGCLFWQPLALQYGKRPVYLISMLATTVNSMQTGVGWSLELTIWYRLLRCGCLTRKPMVNGLPASYYKDFLGLLLNPYVRYR